MMLSMFEQALAAHFPIIGVYTDDLPNFQTALYLLSGRKVLPWPTTKTVTLGPYLYYTDDLEHVTVDNYHRLVNGDYQLVVINPSKQSSLIFDGGILPTPIKMIEGYLKDDLGVPDAELPTLLSALKGLSLKTASEVMQLTMVRSGGMTPQEVRRTRTLVGESVQGLYLVDTDLDFYSPPPQLSQWLNLNAPFFHAPNTPMKLMPRGLMLAGPPGVGKSMAAKAIANQLGVPLFRLDVATTLNKYIGESESRIARSLGMIERESPCILLVDEVEKIFGGGGEDSGVTTRILSQLLWWLADHRSRVLTIMTTNDLKSIPPELYRPGRVDMVLDIPKLKLSDAKTFSIGVFQSVLGKNPTMQQQAILRDALDAKKRKELAHSEVAELVYEVIKINGWFVLDPAKLIAQSA